MRRKAALSALLQKIGALAARRDALAAIDETGARKQNSESHEAGGGCIGNGTIFHTIAPALKERPLPIIPQQVGRFAQ